MDFYKVVVLILLVAIVVNTTSIDTKLSNYLKTVEQSGEHK